MRLWTIQPIEVLEEIKNKGYYICNPNKSNLLLDNDSRFEESYTWLNKQMITKIGVPPKGVKYPVWAWYRRNNLHRKPDLRESGYAKRGKKCVCIEIEKYENEVVLSDFDAWHYVLNNWYNDNSLNEEDWNKENAWFDSLSNIEKENVKIKSWEKIFNVSRFENDWKSNGSWVQATFWVLYAKDIMRVQHFITK